MRLQLNLRCKPGTTLPFNYQYYLSAAIYRVLSQSDNAFTTRLHEQGYLHASKRYKLFHFSNINFPRGSWKTQPGGLKTTGTQASLRIGFLMPKALETFVAGLFQKASFELADRNFRSLFEVEAVQTLSPPEFTPVMRYRLTTPLCLKKDRADGSTLHMAPGDDGYAELLNKNLLNKWRAAQPLQSQAPEGEFNFSLLPGRAPKSKTISVKNIKLKGWLFNFELTAPFELHEVAYYAGFGVEGSQGFGWAELIPPQKDFVA